MSRKKIFMKSAALGYINMILVMIIGIVSQPMMLNQLGVTEFGIWTLTLNLLTYIGNSNVGIPGAALVYISKSNSYLEKKDIVKKAFKLLTFISIIVGVLFLILIIVFPNWFLVMGNFGIEFYNIVKVTMIISVVLFLIRSPFQLAQSAFNGYQDIDINKLYEILNAVVPFISLILIVIFNKSIITLAIFTGVGYIIVNLIATIHLIQKYKYFDKDTYEDINDKLDVIGYKDLIRSGAEFFILGIGSALIYNTDNLVISNFVGVDKISSYNFSFKLYQMAIQVMNIFTGISMPLYGNAFINKDFKWIKSLYNNMITLFPIFAGAIWIGGMMVGRDILDIWSGNPNIFSNYTLLFALGGFTYSLSIVNVNSTFLSGIDAKKESARLIWVEAIVNLILSIILGCHMGIAGVAMGTFISSICVPLIFLPKYINKYTYGNVKFLYKDTMKHFCIAVLPILTIVTITTSIIYKQNPIIKIILVILVMIIYIAISYFLIPRVKRNEYKLIIEKINYIRRK